MNCSLSSAKMEANLSLDFHHQIPNISNPQVVQIMHNKTNSLINDKSLNSIYERKQEHKGSAKDKVKGSLKGSLIWIKEKTKENQSEYKKKSTLIFEKNRKRYSINMDNEDEEFFAKEKIEENLKILRNKLGNEYLIEENETIKENDETEGHQHQDHDDRGNLNEVSNHNDHDQDQTNIKLKNEVSMFKSFQLLKKSLTSKDRKIKTLKKKLTIEQGQSKLTHSKTLRVNKTACDSFNINMEMTHTQGKDISNIIIKTTEDKTREEIQNYKKIIHSKSNNHQSHMTLTNSITPVNLPSSAPFELCLICDDFVNKKNIIILDCKHTICTKCGKNFYEDKIEMGEINLKCPLYNCKFEVSKEEVIKKLVSEIHFLSWMKNSEYEREREELLAKIQSELNDNPEDNRNQMQMENLINSNNNNINLEIEVDNKVKFNTEIAIYNKFNYNYENQKECKDLNKKNTQKTAFNKPSILDTIKNNVKGLSRKHVGVLQ